MHGDNFSEGRLTYKQISVLQNVKDFFLETCNRSQATIEERPDFCQVHK